MADGIVYRSSIDSGPAQSLPDATLGSEIPFRSPVPNHLGTAQKHGKRVMLDDDLRDLRVGREFHYFIF
jgi:hypothetical protein